MDEYGTKPKIVLPRERSKVATLVNVQDHNENKKTLGETPTDLATPPPLAASAVLGPK